MKLAALLPPPGAARPLTTSSLINTIGSGLYLPSSALFFTQVAGLPISQVALGLGVAGVVSLCGGVPLGKLADTYGPRRVYAVLLLVQALAMTAFTWVNSFVPFLLTAGVYLLADQGSAAARGALVASVGSGEARVRLRAYLRAATNVAIAAGAAMAGVAIQIGTPTAYTALILGNAATFLGAMIPLWWVPEAFRTRTKPSTQSRWQVLRDWRFAKVTFLCGVLSLNADIRSFAIPLWVAGHTSAPHVMISVLTVLNTALVVCFQMAASRGADEIPRARLLCRRSGLALLFCCIALGLTQSTPTWLAVSLLLLSGILMTAGEIWWAAGTFGLSFGLAPDHAQGEYQGFFAMGRGVAKAFAPWLLASLCIGGGTTGWFVLGGLLAAAGVLLTWNPRDVKSAEPRTPGERSMATHR